MMTSNRLITTKLIIEKSVISTPYHNPQ